MRRIRQVALPSVLLFLAASIMSFAQVAPAAASGSYTPSHQLGVGVTAHTVKIGIATVDFTCIQQYVTQIRTNQDSYYNDFIRNINAHGGIAGKRIVPVFASFCPIQNGPALALCTKFTEDDHVFAVMGDFVDFSGNAQTCIAKDHQTVLMTFDLSQAIINESPPGLIILPGQTPERADTILISLLNKQHILQGKKVAVLGETDSQSIVDSSVLPALKRTGVKMGSTAILNITGADTSEAQSQLDSFIARWKSENVTSLYVSGTQVASQQFIEVVRQQMPNVQLISDDNSTDIQGYGQEEQKAGRNPNPYEGIITTGGPTSQEYDKSSNWKYCASIYKKETGKVAPNAVQLGPVTNGKTNDIYGAISDPCQLLTEFQEIGNRVGRYLDNKNWVHTVNNFGPIRDVGAGQYASLHTGKYDDNDTYRLEDFDSSDGPQGLMKAMTPLEDIPSS